MTIKIDISQIKVEGDPVPRDIGKIIRACNGSVFIDDSDNYIPPYTIQGSVAGYLAGGGEGTLYTQCEIAKFPFASDAGATFIGSLGTCRTAVNSNTGTTHGYISGGSCGDASTAGGCWCANTPRYIYNTIKSFPFAADEGSTDVGTLAVRTGRGGDMNSETTAYQGGGARQNAQFPSPNTVVCSINTIQKFPFASTTGASVATATVTRRDLSGLSDTHNGYFSGGGCCLGPSALTRCSIEKFSYSSEANSVCIGDLSNIRMYHSSVSAALEGHGYVLGGGINYQSPSGVPSIDKISFASDGNATCIGALTAGGLGQGRGLSAMDYGYIACNVIYKFPYASEGTQTCIGPAASCGSQYGTFDRRHMGSAEN